MRVCQGHYDASLLKAWEDWDGKHGSENDHPKEFPEKQVPCKAQFTPFLLIANSCLPLFIYILFFEWILCLGRLIFFLQSGDNYFDHFKCHWLSYCIPSSAMLSLFKNMEVRILRVLCSWTLTKRRVYWPRQVIEYFSFGIVNQISHSLSIAWLQNLHSR